MKKLLVLLISVLLFADDIPDDFKDFNDEFKPFISKKRDNLKFSGNLKVRYYHFFKHTHYKEITNRQDFLDGLLEINGRYNKNSNTLNSTIFFMGGNFSSIYKTNGVFLDEFRDLSKKVPIIGIKEAYYLHSFDNFDFTIGKMVYVNSASIIYCPNDIYNITLAPDPLDSYKIGSWLIKFNYYKGDAIYTFAIFPFISPSKLTSPKTRWSGDEKHRTTGNFNNLSPSQIEFDKANKVRGLIGYRNSINGMDIISNIGVGASPYAVLLKTSNPNKYKQYYPKDIWFSIGFSTTYKKLEIHSEAYYQVVEANEDDDFISAVVGGKYTWTRWLDKIKLKQIDIILEYAKEIIVDKMNNKKVYKSSEDSRVFKNDILLKIEGKINYKWSLNYFANFRLSTHQQKDSGRYQQIGATYKIKDGLESGVYLEFFNGDENSYYGQWKNNDRIITQIKYSF